MNVVGHQVVTRDVHRSSFRRLMCPAQYHFIVLALLIMSIPFVLSITHNILVLLSLFVRLSIPTNRCASYHQIWVRSSWTLPTGSDQPWLCWYSLNRLPTGIGRAKTTMRRWGYIDNTQSVNSDCGEHQIMAHLLCGRLIDERCSSEYIITGVTEKAKAFVRMWQHIVWMTREKNKHTSFHFSLCGRGFVAACLVIIHVSAPCH